MFNFGKIEERKMKNVKGQKLKIGGSYWDLWGIPIFGRGKKQVLSIVEKWLIGRQKKWIATVNPEFVMEAMKEANFKRILVKKTDLNVMDGIGLVWARELRLKKGLARWIKGFLVAVEILLGKHGQKVVAGSELMEDMGCLTKKRGYRMFFLGGWGDRAKRTAESFERKYKGLKVGWSPGRPEVKKEVVIAKINRFKPQILLVAYGMKSQEEWIERNLKKLEVGVVMGVGRSFDYYSGDLKRAPKVWRKIGLEWLYSLIREPRRWRRQVALVGFVVKVLLGKGF